MPSAWGVLGREKGLVAAGLRQASSACAEPSMASWEAQGRKAWGGCAGDDLGDFMADEGILALLGAAASKCRTGVDTSGLGLGPHRAPQVALTQHGLEPTCVSLRGAGSRGEAVREEEASAVLPRIWIPEPLSPPGGCPGFLGKTCSESKRLALETPFRETSLSV